MLDIRLKLIPKGVEKILDAGCGNGKLGSEIKQAVGAEVYGVDISSENCKKSSSEGLITKEANLNEKIPFEDKFFDAVFAGDIIEHLINPDQFLKEAKRVLKENGCLIIITPNLASWHNRLLLLLGLMPYGIETSIEKNFGFGMFKTKMNKPAGHLRGYTLGAIKEMLEYYGFKIEKIMGKSVASLPTPLKIFSLVPSLSSYLMIRAKKAS